MKIIQLNNSENIYIAFKSKLAKAGKQSIVHKLELNKVEYTIISGNDCVSVGHYYDADICAKTSIN